MPGVYESQEKEMQKKEEQFLIHFQDIVEELKEAVNFHDTSGLASKHIERILKYNVADLADPNGIICGGLIIMSTFELYAPTDMQTEENIKLASYLGCCFEMLRAVAYIVDDIIDSSVTRQNKTCWYKLEDIDLSAINDAFMLESSMYFILKKHFSHLDCYVKIVQLYREIVFVGSIGEHLDIQTQYQDFTTFTMDQYKKLVQNKTIYPGGYIPMTIALHFAGVTDPDIFQKTKSMCLAYGELYQFQNDFNDCYGDPEVNDNIGKYIEEGKCTWLAVKFLEIATPAQKEIFKENYGKTDPCCVKKIKQLYDELSIRDICIKHETDSIDMIRKNPDFFGKIANVFEYFFVKQSQRYNN
ncbi:farnesyl pyrophosphate synthase-like [Phlebotomus papatasi]|uniref:farnesyl pyrophosphate synthase-like n=1 Tax=Phlebotomus papatasi TaxID=29031 RepID=UPI0024842C0B|nr:farnesyl pyrophosphate synthase-like [Phlebotomus papatasi]